MPNDIDWRWKSYQRRMRNRERRLCGICYTIIILGYAFILWVALGTPQ